MIRCLKLAFPYIVFSWPETYKYGESLRIWLSSWVLEIETAL
jgi:hypothetical protein